MKELWKIPEASFGDLHKRVYSNIGKGMGKASTILKSRRDAARM
jgi:hypothetical protein